MRTLIIDDEPAARNRLRDHIGHYCPQLLIVGEGESVEEGVKLIGQLRPELVFLDVVLPDGTGFELVDQLESVNFHVIFITAYNTFAIQAFQYNAVHYILKPFLPEDILAAVSKVEHLRLYDMNIKALTPVLRYLGKSSKVAIPSVSKVNYVDSLDIIRCEADGAYTTLYLKDGTTLLSTKPLKEYEDLLQPMGFCRIHRSHLINLDEVCEYRKGNADAVVLKDGTVIEVSRKKRIDFLMAMSKD